MKNYGPANKPMESMSRMGLMRLMRLMKNDKGSAAALGLNRGQPRNHGVRYGAMFGQVIRSSGLGSAVPVDHGCRRVKSVCEMVR